MPADRVPLGAFLRARRDGLTPEQAGVAAFPGSRRVPGLRKEELAVLAGVSPDYYSRVEQGRQANISRSVLEALARALRLDDVERAHLFVLADPSVTSGSSSPSQQQAAPGLLRLMTAMDSVPALVLGRRGTVLATNTLLTAVLTELPPRHVLPPLPVLRSTGPRADRQLGPLRCGVRLVAARRTGKAPG